VAQALAQERKFCSSKRLTFDELEFVNLGLNGTIAVDLGEPSHDGVFVPLEAQCKALEFGDLTALNCVQPRLKSLAFPFAYHDQEILNQAIDGLNESARLAERGKAGLLFISQILAFANEEPDYLATSTLL